MKKKIYPLIAAIIIFVTLLPATVLATTFPAQEDGMMPPVIDTAAFLTENEATQVKSKLYSIRENYSMDVAIFTEDRMSGYSAEETATAIYDTYPYGMGENYDGILLYISQNPREYYFVTCGYGMEVFNDGALRHLENMVLPYLQADDYYSALLTYADTAAEVLEMAAIGEFYDEDSASKKLVVVATVIMAAILCAVFLTHLKTSQMNTAAPEHYAHNYIVSDSMNIRSSQDIFLYSATTRKPKPKSNNSPSGRSHGGRGGSY